MIDALEHGLTWIGGTAVVVAGIVFLVRQLVAHFLSRALESHKASWNSSLERTRAVHAWHNTVNAKRVDSACLLWSRVVEFAALMPGVGDPVLRDQLVDKHEQMCAAARDCGLFVGYAGYCELMEALGPESLNSLLESISEPRKLERNVEAFRSQRLPNALRAIEQLVLPPAYAQDLVPGAARAN